MTKCSQSSVNYAVTYKDIRVAQFQEITTAHTRCILNATESVIVIFVRDSVMGKITSDSGKHGCK